MAAATEMVLQQETMAHMSLIGTLSVAPGSKPDIIVAGGGSAGGRCARRLGSTGGPATSSDYGDGGRSSIQTSGEDILIAEGGEGGEGRRLFVEKREADRRRRRDEA